MKRTLKATLRYSILLVCILLISACAAKLVDLDRSLPKLNLSEEQQKVVRPKMEAIKEIVDEYSAEKEQVEEELSSMRSSMVRGGKDTSSDSDRTGGGSNLRNMLTEFRKKREAYLSAISIHIEDIKAVLNEEQLAAFEKMERPELEMPDMPMGRRGGRGGDRGGERGGMGGRGGGRRGGGMF